MEKISCSNILQGTDAYCFVTFADHEAAMAGMSFLNGREVFSKVMIF